MDAIKRYYRAIGAQQAYSLLGIEKTAGPVGSFLGKHIATPFKNFIPKITGGIKNFFTPAKNVAADATGAVKNVATDAAKTTGAAAGAAPKIPPPTWRDTIRKYNPFSYVGNKLTDTVGKFSPRAAHGLEVMGQGAGSEMLTGGVLFGGLNAAMAEPGDRLNAFGRGFASGAVGGLGYNVGSNLGRIGMTRALGQNRFLRMSGAASRPVWSNASLHFKPLGSRMALGAPAFAGGMAGMHLIPTPSAGEQPPSPLQNEQMQFAMHAPQLWSSPNMYQNII